MSYFQTNIETIARVEPHPNGDVIEIAYLEGKEFTFVPRKGSFVAGDKAFHIMVDSLVPADILALIGLEGKLSGVAKNRVKTLTLRGVMSQGILVPLDVLFNSTYGPTLRAVQEAGSNDYTTALGITKYEAPEIPCHTANLVALPAGLSKYDIESAQVFPEVLTRLLDIPVSITEKLEGSNYSATLFEDQSLKVNQRMHSIQPIEGAVHDFWKITDDLGIPDKLKAIQAAYYPNQQITFYGEFIGPGYQSNIYKLAHKTVRFFEIKVNGKFLDEEILMKLAIEFAIPLVPNLSRNTTLREWLAGRTLIEASNGPSVLNPKHLREGIVIRPLKEEWIKTERNPFMRLILKQRDPVYLAKTGN